MKDLTAHQKMILAALVSNVSRLDLVQSTGLRTSSVESSLSALRAKGYLRKRELEPTLTRAWLDFASCLETVDALRP